MNSNRYNFKAPEILQELEKLTLFFQKKYFAPDTVRTYGNYTGYFLEWLYPQGISIENVTYNHLLQFVGYCKKESKKPQNINTILIAVRHYFDMLSRSTIGINPATGLHVKGEVKTVPHDLLSTEQLHQLYENYPVYNERTQRNKTMAGLYVYQGITTDELRKLEPRHIYLKEGKIYLPGTNQGHHKSGMQPRKLKLRANQILELQEYLLVTRPKILHDLKTGIRQTQSTRPVCRSVSAGRKPDKINWPIIEQQLFISLNGSENLKPSIRFLMEDLRKISRSLSGSEVKDGQHIRKSVIANWLKEKDIRQVQYMAGHSKISSTEKYRAANLEELEEALKMHHPLS